MSWFPIPRNIPHAVVISSDKLKALEVAASERDELLEALRDVCTQFLGRGVPTDPEHPDHVALKNAEAAIARATGSQP